ncbi:MAG: monooxygenase [Nitrospirae bacterium]|nr:MAG: monooxygenase [Nitrospirota bacterium]
MTERTEVVIVGAGGGGAVLGLALARKGVSTVVLEQAAGPPGGLRGEILQPNGQQVLDRLGLLGQLPPDATKSVRLFHFCRVGGNRLCTVDYDLLPPPYNRAIVTLPNVAHHTILQALESRAPGALRYGVQFRGLLREGRRVVGVEAECGNKSLTISAKLVVGADGAFSKVREALGIPARLHLYGEAYLIAILESPDELEDARYFVGRRTIFGLFPAAGRKVYLFYMIPAGSMPAVKTAGLDALRTNWLRIDPSLEKTSQSLVDWDQTAYMPAARVRTARWVTEGAALIGDAAHAMNPHASQGRMQAMADAMTLADLISSCRERGDWSAEALASYERSRRPQVEMLQRLADEQVLFWNTGNPLLACLRDRVFRTLDRNQRLRYRVLATTAGLRTVAPFGLIDRLMAAGFLRDPHADRLSAETSDER